MARQDVPRNPWGDALKAAINERRQAEEAFQWADAEYLDYHVYRLLAAEEKISLILRQARAAYGIGQPSAILPAAVPDPTAPNGEPFPTSAGDAHPPSD